MTLSSGISRVLSQCIKQTRLTDKHVHVHVNNIY